jgi:hypothetical protein
MVRVEFFGGVEATIHNGKWQSPHRPLRRALQLLQRDALNSIVGAGGPSDPDPDHLSALRAIDTFGGRVVEDTRDDSKPSGKRPVY